MLVGLIGYCDFPLQWVVGSALSPTRSYISELAVAGQPYYQVFRIGDLVAGIGLAILAGVLVIWRPSSPMRLGSAALVVAAATSVVDALSPMSCAPSVDPRCWAADHAAVSTQLSQLHTISGVVGFTAVLLAMAAYGVALGGQPGMRRLGLVGLTCAAIGGVLGGIEIVTALADTDWTGLFERIHVAIVGTFLVMLTFAVARTTSPASRRSTVSSLPH
ncbi:Uncharacterised protein [Mycobacteroides abscessus subsp. abscessus]|nr:Uncharacterised protein [Mycobacteroides abscessus subsp. abscessus]